MTQLNISNVRLILDSHSRLNNASALFNIPIGFASSVQEGYSACYSITEKDYSLKDNYKIGLLGIGHLSVPNEKFYQSDLRSLIEGSSNIHAGFYEIVEADTLKVGDITSVDVCHQGNKLFDIPFMIVGEDTAKFYIKPIIETFEKPQKKSFMDIITRNPYWDCGVIEKAELTHKYRKLSVHDVIPDRYSDDDDMAA